MKNLLIGLVAICLLIGGGYFVYTKMASTNLFEKASNSATQRTDLNAQKNTIEIKDYSYAPKTLTIKAGETVTWINRDSMGHDASADDASWKVELMMQSESQSKKFDKAGTYTYHCSPHPWMKGTIIVE